MRYLSIILLFAVGLAGCLAHTAHTATVVPSPTIPVGTALVTAKAGVETAKEIAQQVKPHADDTGKALLNTQDTVHDKTTEALKEAEKANAEAAKLIVQLQTDNAKKDQAIQDGADKYTEFRGRWYIRVVMFIVYAFWWFVGILAFANIAALVLYIWNPLGIGKEIGAFLVHLLPFMNPVSWLQDSLKPSLLTPKT